METANISFQSNFTCCQRKNVHESPWIKSGNVINPSLRGTFITWSRFTYRHMWFSDILHIKCKTSHVKTSISYADLKKKSLSRFQLYLTVLISILSLLGCHGNVGVSMRNIHTGINWIFHLILLGTIYQM